MYDPIIAQMAADLAEAAARNGANLISKKIKAAKAKEIIKKQ